MNLVWWWALPIIYFLSWCVGFRNFPGLEILLFSSIFIIPLIVLRTTPKDNTSGLLNRCLQFLELVIETGILLLVSLVPWVIDTMANDAGLIKIIYFELISITIFTSWIVSCVIRKEFKLLNTALNIPIILFLIWCIVTFFTSQYRYASLETLYRFVTYIMLFFVIINNLRDWLKIRRILTTLLITTGLMVVYGIVQAFGYDFIGWASQNRIPSSMCCPDNFADYLLLVIPIICAILISLKDMTKKIEMFLFVVASVIAFFLTYSGGAWLSISAAFLIYLIIKLYLLKKDNPSKFRISLLSFILILVLFAGIINFCFLYTKRDFKNSFIHSSIYITAKETVRFISNPYKFSYIAKNLDSTGVKITLWSSTYKMFLKNPIFGVGLGVFQQVFPEYRPQYYRFNGLSHNSDHAHNEFLEILVEMGIVGFVLFLWIIIAFIKTGIKNLTNTDKTKQNLIFAGVVGIVAILLSSLKTGCPTLRQFTSPFLWLTMGLTIALVYIKDDLPLESNSENSNKKALGAGAIIFCSTILWLVGFFLMIQPCRYYLSDVHLRSGVLCSDTPQGWDIALREYKKALSYEPTNIEAQYKMAYIYAQKKNWDEALKLYLEIIRLAPNYTQIHYNLAITYYNLGQIDMSLEEFKKTVELDNSNYVAYFMLGVCYSAEEQWEKALDAFNNAVKSRAEYAHLEGTGPDYPAAHFNIGNIYYRMGKLDKAIQEYKIVLKIEPDNDEAIQKLMLIRKGKNIN